MNDLLQEAEGVTKFLASHTDEPIPAWIGRQLGPLVGVRQLCFERGWVGCDPARYGGVGFGNVSVRVGPLRRPRGQRAFVVSGTQTGELSAVTAKNFAWVRAYQVRRNWVLSQGLTRPSSESMTHGTLYDVDPTIGAVIHVHWPQAWRARFRLDLVMTPADVRYGTQAMAQATQGLFEVTDVATRRLYAMGGHLDGIVSFGASADDALRALLRLAQTLEYA